MNKSVSIVAGETIERCILVIRGHKVLLDSDLATLYGVETKVLNQAVTRNIGRFPEDFMFRLSDEEFEILKSQIVTASWGGRRIAPCAFTEQGVAMLSSVLRSSQAIQVNIAIMRIFVQMREAMASHTELSARIDDIEKKHDARFRSVFDAIRKLMEPPPVPK